MKFDQQAVLEVVGDSLADLLRCLIWIMNAVLFIGAACFFVLLAPILGPVMIARYCINRAKARHGPP